VHISKNELSNYAITGAEFWRRQCSQMSSDSDYDIDGDRDEEDGPYKLILYVDGCDSDDSYYDDSDDSDDSDDPGDFVDVDDSDDEAILTI
jgi:hypothetical protein